MEQGENKMAVVTFTVSVAGGVATLTPDPDAIKFSDRDFVVLKNAAGTTADIKVKVVANGLPEIVVAIADQTPANARRLVLGPPTIDPDGSVLITFANAGGSSGGFPPG